MGALPYGIIKSEGDRLYRLTKAQNGTMNDIVESLNSHGIALMVRPTGFGKTYTLVNLCNKYGYKHIIYMYPTNVIPQSIKDDYHTPEKANENKYLYAETLKESKETGLPLIEFCSYAKMLRMFNAVNKQIDSSDKTDKAKEDARKKWAFDKFKDVDLLIIDEAHMTGASGFQTYWKYIHRLATENPNKTGRETRLHIVGATATPFRTSPQVDIEKDVFYYNWGQDHKSSKIRDFRIFECWSTGILKKPYYTKGILDKETEEAILCEKLKEAIYGKYLNKIKDGNSLVVSKANRKGGEVVDVNNSTILYKNQVYEETCSEVVNLLNRVPEPPDLIRNAVESVNSEIPKNGDYMRFLVFYPNIEIMGKTYEKINQAFKEAFNIGEPDSTYNKLNSYNIFSKTDRVGCTPEDDMIQETDDIGLSDISTIKVGKSTLRCDPISIISDRDNFLKTDKNHGNGNIDLIHSINMLNMGYHVGKVTGVVINRATASEIIYYQQIGRCISVHADNTPIIIDFANAENELFGKTNDTIRQQAADQIKNFITNCSLSDSYESVNLLYDKCRLSISDRDIPDELIEHLYIDRHAPIYFIKGIAESMNCQISIEELIERLIKLDDFESIDRNIELELAKDSRLCKEMVTLINKEYNYIETLIKSGKLTED